MGTRADATVTSKGQATIPKEIRDRLDLEARQAVEFLLEDGEGRVRPKESPIERLRSVIEEIRDSRGSIDVDAIRREVKREWESVPRGADADEPDAEAATRNG